MNLSLDNIVHTQYIKYMKILRVRYIALLLLLPLISTLFAGARIAEPGVTARSTGNDVIIIWQTLEETNLKHFVVQRKSQGGPFADIATVMPEKNRYYEYVDETAYKISESIYVYRIAIVDNNGTTTYSSEVTVLHDNISSVKKTWGSIKALFR